MSKNWSYRPKRGRPRKIARGKPVAEKHIPIVAARANAIRQRIEETAILHLEDMFAPVVALALKAAVVKSLDAHGLLSELKVYVDD